MTLFSLLLALRRSHDMSHSCLSTLMSHRVALDVCLAQKLDRLGAAVASAKKTLEIIEADAAAILIREHARMTDQVERERMEVEEEIRKVNKVREKTREWDESIERHIQTEGAYEENQLKLETELKQVLGEIHKRKLVDYEGQYETFCMNHDVGEIRVVHEQVENRNFPRKRIDRELNVPIAELEAFKQSSREKDEMIARLVKCYKELEQLFLWSRSNSPEKPIPSVCIFHAKVLM